MIYTYQSLAKQSQTLAFCDKEPLVRYMTKCFLSFMKTEFFLQIWFALLGKPFKSDDDTYFDFLNILDVQPVVEYFLRFFPKGDFK